MPRLVLVDQVVVEHQAADPAPPSPTSAADPARRPVGEADEDLDDGAPLPRPPPTWQNRRSRAYSPPADPLPRPGHAPRGPVPPTPAAGVLALDAGGVGRVGA